MTNVPRRGLTMNPMHERVRLALYRIVRFGTLSNSEAKAGSMNPAYSHGMTGTGAYRSWVAMKKRCTYPGHPAYSHYSKLGILPAWEESFEEFYSALGDRPEGMSLDRIDPAVGYFPGNVRWLPRGENSARARRRA